MDPLTAIGLASNIIAFVDFSSKLVKIAAEVRRSTSGVTEDIEDAITISESLKSMLAGLQTPPIPATAPHEDEKLVLLAKNCSKACIDLQELVQKIKGKPSSSGLGPAWRVLWNGRKLAAMETKLEKFRGQILGHVQVMMSHKASATHNLLEDLAKSQMTVQATKESLAKMKNDILAAVRAEHENVNSQTSAIQELRKSIDAMSMTLSKSIELSQAPLASVQHPLLEAIREALVTLSTAAANASADEQILEWLWFSDLHTREALIDRAHEGTYRWMLYSELEKRVPFDAASSSDVSNFPSVAEAAEVDLVPTACPGKTNEFYMSRKEEVRLIRVEQQLHSKIRRRFVQWLEHDNGLFYISGKPGSGKSTLMKYIAEEEQTTNLLTSWAGDSRLVLARFFFWRAGGNLQKSARGLYRGILWEIIRQCPGSAELVFPTFWHGNRRANASTEPAHRPPPEQHELEAAFGTLSKNPKILQQIRICLFIDGLDEYEGDYWKLGKALKQACDSPNIKICAASRHYNEFQRLFVDDGTAHTWIQVHDLTRRDMTRFVADELEGDERFRAIRHTSYDYDNIVSDLVRRAEGVFLWTKFVVQQLLKDLTNQVSPTQLRRRLTELPNGLDALFRQILSRLDLVERRRLARTVLSMLALTDQSENPGTWVYVQYVIDNLFDDPGSEIDLLDGTIDHLMAKQETVQICNQMKKRLWGRGQGLLEVQSSGVEVDDIWRHQVKFTHRSVVDFLKSPDIFRDLQMLAGDFSCHKTIVLGILSILKNIAGGTMPIEMATVPSIFLTERVLMAMAPDSPLLLAEIASLCRLLERRAALNEGGTVFLAPATREGFKFPAHAPEDIEDAIACISVFDASPQLARKLVNSRIDYLRCEGENILLLASGYDFDFQSSWASSLTRIVFAYSPNPNRGATWSANLDKGAPWGLLPTQARPPVLGPLIGMPEPNLGTWTDWTVLLQSIHRLLNYHSYRLSYNLDGFLAFHKEISKYLEAYLSFAADPSVCFVGFTFSDLDFSLETPCYFDLSTMVDIWAIPTPAGIPKEMTLVSNESGSWLRRYFSRAGVNSSKPQRLGSENANMACFWLVAVVPFKKLEEVPLSEVSRVWEQRRPEILRICKSRAWKPSIGFWLRAEKLMEKAVR